MSSVKTETFTPLQPEDIVPGDPAATIWRWCLRNDWVFHPDFNGNEPKIDTRCAWAIVSPEITFKTAKDGILSEETRSADIVLLDCHWETDALYEACSWHQSWMPALGFGYRATHD
ncbi:MAG: hypothetical protein ABGZ53_05980 [Fuerstiella sp.]